MAPSRHDWKIVDWDVKPQHNQPTNTFDLDYWAKTRYQPIFRHCLDALLQYLAIFYENPH